MESKKAAKVESKVELGNGELARTSNYPFCLCPSPRPPVLSPLLPPLHLLYSLLSPLCRQLLLWPQGLSIPSSKDQQKLTNGPDSNSKYLGEKIQLAS